LTVAATDMISIAGSDQEGNASGLFSLAMGSGDAGNLDVRVRQLTLTGGAQISSSTRGSGHGGTRTGAATEGDGMSGGGGGRLRQWAVELGRGEGRCGPVGHLGRRLDHGQWTHSGWCGVRESRQCRWY